MHSTLRIAVVGGGWAGLAAAVELSAAGAAVTVFEAAKQLGGRARGVEIDGQALDNGQHILIGAYRETLRLMQQVGAEPGRRLVRLPLALDYPGAGFRIRLPRLPAPLHLAAGLLGTQGSNFAEKLAAIRFIRHLQTCDYRLAKTGTVAALLDHHGQYGALRRYLWEPLCLAALNTLPENACAQIFANVLRDSLGGSRADTDLLLPASDLGELFPNAAARFIAEHGGAIQLSTRVDHISAELDVADTRFDRVVLAAAPQHAATLLAAHTATATIAAKLAGYAYEPIATLYAGYPPDLRLPAPMLGLAGGTGGRLGQWVFDRGVLGGAPGAMSFVLSARSAWGELDNATLAAALHGELEEALARQFAPPLWYRVIREQRATFSCRPGLFRPTAQTPLPGLWLAGDYVAADYPATLEGAVRSGVAAARAILTSAAPA